MVNEKIKAAEENLIHVYNRFPIALERGRVFICMTPMEKNILILRLGLRCQVWDMEMKSSMQH